MNETTTQHLAEINAALDARGLRDDVYTAHDPEEPFPWRIQDDGIHESFATPEQALLAAKTWKTQS